MPMESLAAGTHDLGSRKGGLILTGSRWREVWSGSDGC